MVRAFAVSTALLIFVSAAVGCVSTTPAAEDTAAVPAEAVLADDPRLEPLFAYLEAENLTVLRYFARMPPLQSQAEIAWELSLRSREGHPGHLTVWVYVSEAAAQEEQRRFPSPRSFLQQSQYRETARGSSASNRLHQRGSLLLYGGVQRAVPLASSICIDPLTRHADPSAPGFSVEYIPNCRK